MTNPTDTPYVLGDEFIQQAHEVAASLRDSEPVRFVVLPGGMPVWLVTGYEEARQVAVDPRFSSHQVYDRMWGGAMGDAFEEVFPKDLTWSMLNLDPPDHTRLRSLVVKVFTQRSIAALRPRIEKIADELLDDMEKEETVDLLPTYAYPLPIKVICELLGVPFEDREDFTEWSNKMVAAATLPEVGAACTYMVEYLRGLADAKDKDPGDDLITRLVQVSEDSARLSRAEVVATAIVLLTGGFETTVNLISSGMLALLRHPDQLALLRSNPELLPNAVEEFLRFETPNNLSSPRYTTEPVTIGDVEIPAGHFVMVSWLSANRDHRFAEPDKLDISRRSAGHLAFGHGIHFCVGAPLARLEGEVAFSRLLDRFPDVELEGDPSNVRWRNSTAMHGVDSLMLRLSPSERGT